MIGALLCDEFRWTLALAFLVTGCSTATQDDDHSAGTTEVSDHPSDDGASELAAEVDELPVKDRMEYFAEVVQAGRTGVAKKTAAVTARPAEPGETVISRLEGDGIETVSAPADDGDMVVRSDCGDNQETEILVSAEKFSTRYGEPQSEPDADEYRRHLPVREEMDFVIVSSADGQFAIEAPWGEKMVVRPGDAVVRIPSDPQDIYRIYAPAFECTYEIVEPASR